jgi:hypothetical protein
MSEDATRSFEPRRRRPMSYTASIGQQTEQSAEKDRNV